MRKATFLESEHVVRQTLNTIRDRGVFAVRIKGQYYVLPPGTPPYWGRATKALIANYREQALLITDRILEET